MYVYSVWSKYYIIFLYFWIDNHYSEWVHPIVDKVVLNVELNLWMCDTATWLKKK